MPIHGQKPKPPGQAITRTPRLEFVEVPNVRQKPRPIPRRRDFGQWPAGMVAKWRAWSSMPHTVLWSETDWEYAVDSLHVAARAIESTSPTHMAELRQRERAMGTTVDSRRDIRVRWVDPPAPDEAQKVANLDDYRSL